MSHNSFGHLFRITTWGESHGVAIGCVVDGCHPASPSPKPRSSPISTSGAPANRATPPSGRSLTKSASCQACSPTKRARKSPPERRSRSRLTMSSPLEGLRRHQGQVPPRPCRLHLSVEIWTARLARLRPGQRAGDGEAGRGRSHRAQSGAGHSRAWRACPDRAPRDRSAQFRLG